MKTLIPVAAGLLAISQFAASAQTASSALLTTQPESKPPAVNPAIKANFANLPLSFEANQGQSDGRVKFLSRGQGYSLFLTDREAVLALHKNELQSIHERGGKPTLPAKSGKTDVVRMELDGASHGLRVIGEEPLPGKSNYFIGKDPSKWRTNVPTYSKVKYTGVYPGIDLVYYGNQQQLEYDFVVAPNADPNQARLHFAGASKLKLNHDGDLEIIAKDGEIAFHKPVVYQMKDNQRQAVEGSFKLVAKNTVGFELGSYDRSRQLVVDPTLGYSTYLGGSTSERGYAIVADSSGTAYVTGLTVSDDFPVTAGAFQRQINYATQGIFISKFNASGSALLYSTVMSGTIDEGACITYSEAIRVDPEGNAYVAGSTSCIDFPVTSGAFQTTNHQGGNNTNGFLTKLNPSGSALIYSTYLGGSGSGLPGGGDGIQALVLDASSDAYVSGATNSRDFPVTSSAFQKVNKDPKANKLLPFQTTGFVAELNSAGTQLIYSTYLGGSAGAAGDGDSVNGIAIDNTGSAYVTGTTSSSDFPTTPGSFQPVAPEATPATSAFVTRLSSDGSALLYSTFLGGTGVIGQPASTIGDHGVGIALDSSNLVYVTGTTRSATFPVTPGAFQLIGNGYTGFVSVFNLEGPGLVYSTFLGGSAGYDTPSAIAVGINGLPTIAERQRARTSRPPWMLSRR